MINYTEQTINLLGLKYGVEYVQSLMAQGELKQTEQGINYLKIT